MEVSDAVTEIGSTLVDRHPLRGFDAIHLASALLLRERAFTEVSFSCFDEKLKAAARAEGLEVT